MAQNSNKNIKDNQIPGYGVSYSDEPYYGIQILVEPNSYAYHPGRNGVIEAVNALRVNEYFNFGNAFEDADLADFTHTLSDHYVGEALYERFCSNFSFCSNLQEKAYDIDAQQDFDSIIFIANEGYGENNNFKIISQSTPITVWLKSQDEFQSLVKRTIFEKNVQLGKLLFDSKEDTKFVIDSYKYENDKIKQEIKRLKKTIKELEQKHDANKALISSLLVDLKQAKYVI